MHSAELLQARLADLRLEPEGLGHTGPRQGRQEPGWAVPGQTFDAFQEYLDVRSVGGGIETAPPDAPLLASTLDPMVPIGTKRYMSTCEAGSQGQSLRPPCPALQ